MPYVFHLCLSVVFSVAVCFFMLFVAHAFFFMFYLLFLSLLFVAIYKGNVFSYVLSVIFALLFVAHAFFFMFIHVKFGVSCI